MKKCNKCRIKKETTEFYNHPNTIDGLQQPCKSCRAIIHQHQRKENLLVANTEFPLPYHNQLYLPKTELQKELENCREKLQKKEALITYFYQDQEDKGKYITKLEAEVKLFKEQLNVELAERREVLNQLHFIQAEVPRDEAYSYRHQQLMETLSVSNTLMTRIIETTITEAIQRDAIQPKKQNIWQKFLNLITEGDK